MENIFATFLQTAGLYDSKEICEDNIADLIELLKGNVKISAYCKECKQERVFHMKPIEYYFETGPEGDEEIRCASLACESGRCWVASYCACAVLGKEIPAFP